MSRSRGAFRYPVDLHAWVHAEGRPSSRARVVDLSRTGAGIRLLTSDEGLAEPFSPADPHPSLFAPGEPIRVAVVDLIEGRPLTRQWQGWVAHVAAEDSHAGGRLGLIFEPGEEPHRSTPCQAEVSGRPAGEACLGVDWLLGLPPQRGSAPLLESGVAVSALAADQLSKAWAWALAGGSPGGTGEVLHLVPDLLSVVPAANAGTVASLGSSLPLTSLLCATSALALAGLVPLWRGSCRRTESRDCLLASLGSGLLTAGLVGNSIDRLTLGYVRDFLVSGVMPLWAFNLADLFLLAGALALLANQSTGSTRSYSSVQPADATRMMT
ncbi:MAG: signal peptidase II [Isosphaeraceae bacterium]